MNILLKIGLVASMGIGSLYAAQGLDQIADYLLATVSQPEDPTQLSYAEALTVWSGEASRATKLITEQVAAEVYTNEREAELNSNFLRYCAALENNIKFLVSPNCPYEVFTSKLTKFVTMLLETRIRMIKFFGYELLEDACECGLVTLEKLLNPLMIHISKATTLAQRDQLLKNLTELCQIYQNFCVLCLGHKHAPHKTEFDAKATWCSTRLQTM